MIPVSGLKTQGRIVRETTAPFVIFDEDGSERTEEITVRFYTFSIVEGRAYRNEIAELKDDAVWSDLVFPLIAGLPDFVDDKGKPVKVTKELLESFNTINLQAIHKAIGEAVSPKSQPSRSPGG